MSTQPAVEKMVFRKTNQHVGRRVSVTPLTARMFICPMAGLS